MVHPGGRPRTSSPAPEECLALGEEMLLWATEKSKDWRCLFQQWYSLKKGMSRKEWKTLIQSPEFLPYYEIVQSLFAVKCVTGYMKDGFAQRYIRLYDKHLVEEEDDHAKFMSDLRKSEDTAKQSHYTIMVPNGLSAGTPVSTTPIPTVDNKGPE